ncbi:hypothetical protein [Arthrobacter sp. FW306-2-2C-D06B]|uniref:hypothetical protein n=1 Tax=Arthrobacter sp. FW306-2-2C-D06B TaxID=2879618 RepID=UPI003019987C
MVASDIINLRESTFAFRATDGTNATAAAVARAFLVIRESYELSWFVDKIADLAPSSASDYVEAAVLFIRRILDRATRCYVTHDHSDRPVANALRGSRFPWTSPAFQLPYIFCGT